MTTDQNNPFQILLRQIIHEMTHALTSLRKKALTFSLSSANEQMGSGVNKNYILTHNQNHHDIHNLLLLESSLRS